MIKYEYQKNKEKVFKGGVYMYYYRITAENGYVGCAQEWYTSCEKPFDREDEETIQQMAIDEMSMYDYLSGSDDAETEEEAEELLNSYYEEICGSYEEISEKEFNQAMEDELEYIEW